MIGIFDSGIGGLGVMYVIRQKSANADLIYFGDLANMPYGPKSADELFTLTMRAMAFLGSQGATQYVSACNSVSVSVIQPLLQSQGLRDVRIIEMVQPAAKALSHQTSGKILAAATEATVRSGMYERVLATYGLDVEMIALPELASAIERNEEEEILRSIISPAIEKAIEINAKTFVFGCTQYPFVKNLFAKVFGEREHEIKLFDPSEAVAEETIKNFEMKGSGTNKFFVSKSSEVFEDTVRRLFGTNSQVICVDVDKTVHKE
ncbi:MAG: aspartate/glutamate racemase family protein [Patescibacteria group bacterium]